MEELQVTKEGNYYVEVVIGNTYDLQANPVCANCLVPIFPNCAWFACDEEAKCAKPEEHKGLRWYSIYNSRGTDEPAECDECVNAADSGNCGKCGDEYCDECADLSNAAYDARHKPYTG